MTDAQPRYLMALLCLNGLLLQIDIAIAEMRRRGCSVERCRRFHIACKAQALVHFDRDITRAAS